MEITNNDNQIALIPTSKLKCKVCRSPATRPHFGVMSCESCRVFFRRNAHKELTKIKCHFDQNCDIDELNRRVCTYCRLRKCLEVGMSRSFFRETRPTKRIFNKNQIQQLRILNLLRSDRSTLSNDEWNLLSNIIRSYDERSAILVGEDFIRNQNSLPIKLRFKIESIKGMLLLLFGKAQSCFKSNYDFLALNHYDQTVLINSTLQHVVSISTIFALSRSRLLNEPAFIKPLEMVFQPGPINLTKRLTVYLDHDDTFIKLILPIIIFSTINYLYKENSHPINLINLKQILHIQNMYIELAWKYLVYKYDFYQAVKRFSNIIRVIFISTEGIHQVHKTDIYIDIFDSLTKKTEQILKI